MIAKTPVLPQTPAQYPFESKQLDDITEAAIQIVHRVDGAGQLLLVHRAELDQVRGRLADTIVDPSLEEWKRDTLQTYVATIDQIDSAIRVLGVAR